MLGWAAAVLAAAVFLGALLWPNRKPEVSVLGFAAEVLSAEGSNVSEGSCSFASDLTCRRVTFTLLEGPDQGTITQEEWDVMPSAPEFSISDRVLLNRIPEARLRSPTEAQ